MHAERLFAAFSPAPPSLREFLADQFAWRPGRWRAMVRITVCCTITVVLCMLFRIPVPAYAVYLVFLVSGAETATTLLTVVGGAVAATAALMLTLLLYVVDSGEPALRVPLIAAVTFLGMYLSRTIVVGPIAFLAGFVLVITQTLIEDIPTLDALTHFILWLWVVVMVPAGLVALADLAFGQNPARLARDNALHILERVGQRIGGGPSVHMSHCLESTAVLVELRQRAELTSPALRATHTRDLDLVGALDELVRSVTLLPAGLPRETADALQSACAACRLALREDTAPARASVGLTTRALGALDAHTRPVVVAVGTILERLLAGLAHRAHGEAPASSPPPKKPFFVADAFTNPDHVRFALKATLATMLCYIVYSGLDWPGIRTCVVTCFFVALASVGETVHKLTLRLGGALAGGLLGGLCIVFVLPHLTDIGGLAIVCAIVALLGAWISTSSERLAYGGMQLAFAFFIGVLQGYGPTEELTVLRDRVIGILFGNVMMSIVFTTVWPVSAVTQATAALRQARTALGDLLRTTGSGARMALSQTIDRARRLLVLSAFEPDLLGAPSDERQRARRMVEHLDLLVAAVLVVVNQPGARDEGAWRVAAAQWIGNPTAFTAPPLADEAAAQLTNVSSAADPRERAPLEAEILLSDCMRWVHAN